MIPLLLCAYKPRYLHVVLKWFQQNRVPEHFTIMVWDNGGAAPICEKFGFGWFSIRESQTGPVMNMGKAAGFHYLMDVALKKAPNATCYVCMDDDVIVDLKHLDTLVTTALRPGMGMIGARYHPFNTLVRPGGALVALDPCLQCGGPTCSRCQGTGKDPHGLHLRTYPREDRLVHNLGCLGGAIFAIARSAINRLEWAPYLYPIRNEPGTNRPLTYWGEDALLDYTLTALGFVDGYVEHPDLVPVIHLPELDPAYDRWKADVKYKGIYGPMPNPSPGKQGAKIMIPLLICAYKPRYLEVVLTWLQKNGVGEHFSIMVWDNGDASPICARFGIACFSFRESQTGPTVNLGKAAGFHYLMDMALQRIPGASCFVCMDDDIIIDLKHLQTLTATALRPGLGMIGARYHPFNTLVRPGGMLMPLDPCPYCAAPPIQSSDQPCGHCRGTGKDPRGLCLRIYPVEERNPHGLCMRTYPPAQHWIHYTGCVGGAIFAIARDTISRLEWAPYLYPIKYEPGSNRPQTYWIEDALLDVSLTSMGFVDGYLEHTDLCPVIHLPELDLDYARWKMQVVRDGFVAPYQAPSKK